MHTHVIAKVVNRRRQSNDPERVTCNWGIAANDIVPLFSPLPSAAASAAVCALTPTTTTTKRKLNEVSFHALEFWTTVAPTLFPARVSTLTKWISALSVQPVADLAADLWSRQVQ